MDEIRKSFHQQLDDIKQDVIELAAMVVESIPRATQALLDADLTAAQAVIDYDDFLDAKSLEIDEHCLRLLALQQPMASDLRVIMTAMRLNWDLERAGDLACNICKTIRRMYGTPIEPKLRGLIVQMSDEAYRLTQPCDRRVRRSQRGARGRARRHGRSARCSAARLRDRADRATRPQHHAAAERLCNWRWSARYYERLGDHAVNIGERIQYMVTGWLPEHTGAARAEIKKRAAESLDHPTTEPEIERTTRPRHQRRRRFRPWLGGAGSSSS